MPYKPGTMMIADESQDRRDYLYQFCHRFSDILQQSLKFAPLEKLEMVQGFAEQLKQVAKGLLHLCVTMVATWCVASLCYHGSDTTESFHGEDSKFTMPLHIIEHNITLDKLNVQEERLIQQQRYYNTAQNQANRNKVLKTRLALYVDWIEVYLLSI